MKNKFLFLVVLLITAIPIILAQDQTIQRSGGAGGSPSNWTASGTTNSTLAGNAYVNSLTSTGAISAPNIVTLTNLTATWTDGGVNEAIRMNVTDTSSAAASLLLNLLVGNNSKFSVRKDGLATSTSGFSSAPGTSLFGGTTFSGNFFTINDAGGFYWSSGPVFKTGTADFVKIWNVAQTRGASLEVGSLATSLITTTTNYTALASDHTILANGTTLTITLPSAVGAVRREYVVKLIANSTATVATTSSQNIDSATTYSLSAQYKFVHVQSDGSQWWIIGQN